MKPEDLLRYDRRVPRYTSYPTAADFTSDVDAACYRRWLDALPRDATLSLYLHIPFCSSLCWFCGCHTAVARHYGPVAAYLELVAREIDMLAEAVTGRVTHLHWGGGTPTILRPDDIRRLTERLRARFTFDPEAEFAVEIDPRTITRETVVALAETGVGRASLGVQDFDPKVQRAVNRIQPFDLTARVVRWLRDAGIDALNIDLLYGLPRQTVAGLTDTVDKTLELKPHRIALFGYAHVPWMKSHQRLIDEKRLPDARGRLRLFTAASARLVEHGYVAIGLDHFALPTDPIAIAAREGRLHRNFQGYTTERVSALLGLGTSAIGTLPHGYVQNAARTPDYRARITAGEFAIVRGVESSDDDRLRRDIIERLMCDLDVDLAAACRTYGCSPTRFAREIESLAPMVNSGILRIDGNRVSVSPDARAILRVVCAAFDRHLPPEAQRHAPAI